LVKYPRLYECEHHGDSKFTYKDDAELLAWIKKGVKNPDRVPIEAQLADWADTMAYSVNDIEDVVRAGLLSFAELRSRAHEISNDVCEKLEKEAAREERKLSSLVEITSAAAIRELANDLEKRYAKPTELRMRKANLTQRPSRAPAHRSGQAAQSSRFDS
jgi:dGTP triphosphohydrolase